jgi:hypothetical protein
MATGYSRSPRVLKGALHSGHTCYRRAGKHICFTEGKCDEKEEPIDRTAPSISRHHRASATYLGLFGIPSNTGFLT